MFICRVLDERTLQYRRSLVVSAFVYTPQTAYLRDNYIGSKLLNIVRFLFRCQAILKPLIFKLTGVVSKRRGAGTVGSLPEFEIPEYYIATCGPSGTGTPHNGSMIALVPTRLSPDLVGTMDSLVTGGEVKVSNQGRKLKRAWGAKEMSRNIKKYHTVALGCWIYSMYQRNYRYTTSRGHVRLFIGASRVTRLLRNVWCNRDGLRGSTQPSAVKNTGIWSGQETWMSCTLGKLEILSVAAGYVCSQKAKALVRTSKASKVRGL